MKSILFTVLLFAATLLSAQVAPELDKRSIHHSNDLYKGKRERIRLAGIQFEEVYNGDISEPANSLHMEYDKSGNKIRQWIQAGTYDEHRTYDDQNRLTDCSTWQVIQRDTIIDTITARWTIRYSDRQLYMLTEFIKNDSVTYSYQQSCNYDINGFLVDSIYATVLPRSHFHYGYYLFSPLGREAVADWAAADPTAPRMEFFYTDNQVTERTYKHNLSSDRYDHHTIWQDRITTFDSTGAIATIETRLYDPEKKKTYDFGTSLTRFDAYGNVEELYVGDVRRKYGHLYTIYEYDAFGNILCEKWSFKKVPSKKGRTVNHRYTYF